MLVLNFGGKRGEPVRKPVCHCGWLPASIRLTIKATKRDVGDVLTYTDAYMG